MGHSGVCENGWMFSTAACGLLWLGESIGMPFGKRSVLRFASLILRAWANRNVQKDNVIKVGPWRWQEKAPRGGAFGLPSNTRGMGPEKVSEVLKPLQKLGKGTVLAADAPRVGSRWRANRLCVSEREWATNERCSRWEFCLGGSPLPPLLSPSNHHRPPPPAPSFRFLSCPALSFLSFPFLSFPFLSLPFPSGHHHPPPPPPPSFSFISFLHFPCPSQPPLPPLTTHHPNLSPKNNTTTLHPCPPFHPFPSCLFAPFFFWLSIIYLSLFHHSNACVQLSTFPSPCLCLLEFSSSSLPLSTISYYIYLSFAHTIFLFWFLF